MISIFFFIVGIVLIVVGSKKWYKIQKAIDIKQQLENKHLELNISKLTESERVEKVETDIVDLEPETFNQNLNGMSKSETQYKISEYIAVENKVYEYVCAKYYNTHTLKNNVRLGKEEYDIIAISQSMKYNDIIFETKYLKSIITISSLHRMIKQLIEKHSIYSEVTNRVASVVLVIVT